MEPGADLHMAQLMPLPLTVSCFSKIQIGFTFLVPAHPGNPGQRAVKRVCVYVCNWLQTKLVTQLRLELEMFNLKYLFLKNISTDFCQTNYKRRRARPS